jgi:CBS domain-containing protein
VLVACATGIVAASIAALALASSVDRPEMARLVFASVVPLFGTWVGTVLAYYFATKNLEAATKSTADLTDAGARLATTLQIDPATSVRDRMIARANMNVLNLKPTEQLEKIELRRFWNHLASFSRLPVLSAEDKPVAIVHRTLLERYAARLQGKIPDVLDGKLVSDLPSDQQELLTLFATLTPDATVADARAAMAAKGRGCSDVLVTQDGTAATPVVGWLTDTDLAGTPDRRGAAP